jgi:predicted Zn-ribbon and HTH transcriptional regulator
MSRKCFTLTGIVSAALCLAAVALWFRSWNVKDILWLNRPISGRTFEVTSNSGRFAFITMSSPAPIGAGWGWDAVPAHVGYAEQYDQSRSWDPFGYQTESTSNNTGWTEPDGQSRFGVTTARVIGVKQWSLAAITGAVAGLHLAAYLRSRWRDRSVVAGRCSACGYDCRATPDRCPECGTPVAKRAT